MDVKTNIETETNINDITIIETLISIAITPDLQTNINIKSITNTKFIMDVKTNIETETNIKYITIIETLINIAITPDIKKSINIRIIIYTKCIILSLILQLLLNFRRVST